MGTCGGVQEGDAYFNVVGGGFGRFHQAQGGAASKISLRLIYSVIYTRVADEAVPGLGTAPQVASACEG